MLRPAVYDQDIYDADTHWAFVSKIRELMVLLERTFCYYVDMLPKASERDTENWEAEWRWTSEKEAKRDAEKQENALFTPE